MIMRKSVALVLVVALFLVGITVGILGTHVFYAKRMEKPGGIAELALEVIAGRLERELRLRPDQRRELDLIVEDLRVEIKGMRHEIVDRLIILREQSAERLERVLDEDQKDKLEKFRSEKGTMVDRYLDLDE